MIRRDALPVLAVACLTVCLALVPPLPAQAQRTPKKVAVLIGTNEYTNSQFKSLKYCEKDMLKLKEVLELLGFKVILLLGSGEGAVEATRQNIIDTLLNDAESNTEYAFRDITHEDDVALVALSGHGQQIPIKQGTTEIEIPFYCPKRAKDGVPETLISINDVLDKLNSGKAKSLVLVDACRSFTRRVEADGTKSSKGLALDRSVINSLRKNVGGMFACDDRQEAIESEIAGGGHGLFFYSVIESIRTTPKNSRGVVTWEAIVPQIRESVEALTEKVPNLAEVHRQRPVQFGNFNSSVILVPQGVTMANAARVPKGGGEQEQVPTAGEKAVTFEYMIEGEKKKGTAKVLTVDIGDGQTMEFVRISKGKFTMGSPKTEADRDTDEDQKEVTIDKDFYLARYETTQGQYEAVMGTNPSKFKGARLPVETVSWDDAKEFCSAVSKKLGRSVKLPSESQWEYACRAGTTTPYHFASQLNGDLANCAGDYPYGGAGKGKYLQKTADVGSYPANPWGLCDMHGNVWEWCEDKYSNNSKSRVLRGGSWDNVAGYCRAAGRSWNGPAIRFNNSGFRVCLPLD